MKWVFVFLFLAPFIDARFRFFRKDYTFYRDADGWMKFHRLPANWTDARLRCEYEGSILASPLYVKMLQAMQVEIIDQQNAKVFTGISAEFSPGDYYSIDGVSLDKIPIQWATNEPNSRDNKERCTILENGGLADVPCEDTYPFICYKGLSQNIASPGICGTIDPEYNFDSRTNHCYKFHRQGKIWSRAFETCSSEGGYLAIINSDKEADVLKELFDKNPATTIISDSSVKDNNGFIGYIRRDRSISPWYTIHGQTLKEAGYEKWAYGEPNNNYGGVEQNCGGIHRNAEMDDMWCNVPSAFICEKLPRSLLDCGGRTDEIQDYQWKR